MKFFLIATIAFLALTLTSKAQWTSGTGIITTTNNVGIGITTPTSRLTVANGLVNNTLDQTITLVNSNGQTSFGGYVGQRVINGSTRQGLIVSGTGSLCLQAQSYNMDFFTGAIVPADDTNLRMRIDATGNVSIGTTSAQGYKLAVNGSAIATSMTVKLYASWPDFVFKPTYQLPSLTDVKTYIDKNHHLPDVPTAAEVEKNGLNLGEMNATLLKKVEELTLYLIELNKTTAELTKTVKAQQKEIDQLKNK